MKILFSSQAWDDYLHWQQIDHKAFQRINDLIGEILRSPFVGLGKPLPLRHALAGYWSRRIDGEHRLVYKIDGDAVVVAQTRYCY